MYIYLLMQKRTQTASGKYNWTKQNILQVIVQSLVKRSFNMILKETWGRGKLPETVL